MAVVIDVSKSGQYTLEQIATNTYAIKCNGQILRRHGEYPRLQEALWRWDCYKNS